MTDQDYTVKEWKPWTDRETGDLIRDPHQNIKGSLILNGVGEPVDGTFKKEPEAGAVLYGHIEDYTTRAGSTRQRFKRTERPDRPTTSYGKSAEDRDSIYRCNALNNAVAMFAATPDASKFDPIDIAEQFYNWLKKKDAA